MIVRPGIEEKSRMADSPKNEGVVLLSNLPAGRGESRFATTIIAVSSIIFLVLAPFAKLPVAPLPTFIPIYQSALVINDFITVVFLLGQRQFGARQRDELPRRRLSVHRADLDCTCAHLSRLVLADRAARRRAADHGLALHVLARRLSAFRHWLCDLRAVGSNQPAKVSRDSDYGGIRSCARPAALPWSRHGASTSCPRSCKAINTRQT